MMCRHLNTKVCHAIRKITSTILALKFQSNSRYASLIYQQHSKTASVLPHEMRQSAAGAILL